MPVLLVSPSGSGFSLQTFFQKVREGGFHFLSNEQSSPRAPLTLTGLLLLTCLKPLTPRPWGPVCVGEKALERFCLFWMAQPGALAAGIVTPSLLIQRPLFLWAQARIILELLLCRVCLLCGSAIKQYHFSLRRLLKEAGCTNVDCKA